MPEQRRVRVVVWCREPAGDPGAVRRAYDDVSRRLAGTPGLVGNQLLVSRLHPGVVAVQSEWASLAEFREWEEGGEHRDATAALRPFQDAGRTPVYDVYEVVAEY
ncbi:antibiotic biosynthesis monooxygenase [Dactylosporangium sp. AC04546]|uniref:antibiotic biosynthesis monooxygenase family protein n=1 Tax=Dactylosporangium sp. AC04546 TaxID=2862460 RepID=UPI001EDFA87C|nr:antibiotic biosynthesis monooxygenase [Dactylosporangium sp. AC04546]WVK79066.1 antibiotic biosynthesis monooxygenase [Dactylosporangium sp. AC04546]